MKVLVTGATGFVGSHLARRLEEVGHEVVVVSRRRGVGYDWSDEGLHDAVEVSDAVVHLAGRNLFDGRWNARRRAELRSSRVETTERIARLAARLRTRVLVTASAVGYYGPRGDEDLDESSPPGDDFLARLCRDWEAAAAPARDAGVRVATVRIGVVLGRDGGALERLLTPFRLGLGGPVGSGRQPFPWVHVEDLASLLLFLLEHDDARGPFNGTAPGVVDMATFARALGRALHRPAVLPLPGFALRLALGEVADVLLTGQRALPRRALEAGFAFRFPDLDAALRDLVGRSAVGSAVGAG